MNNKFLVLDSGVTKKFTNLALKPGKVRKSDANPLFQEDFFSTPPRKWEVRYDNGYPNVFYDNEHDIYRCYYTLFTIDALSAETSLEERPQRQYIPRPGRRTSLCYAQSEDGIRWTKPDIGTVEFDGNTNNNIMMIKAHGASVFYDHHESDPAKKYKMVMRCDGTNRHMGVAFSTDGLHWSETIPWPKHNPVADSHNFAFWDDELGKYVLITRQWNNGLRVVARCESEDFIHWSEPVDIFKGQGYHQQVYSMTVFKYGHVYLGLASIFRDGDRSLPDWDKVDCELVYSKDTIHWDFVCPGESFIPRGEGDYPDGAYDSGCIYASIPVIDRDEIRLYYMGGNGQHTNFRETSLNLATLKTDRFAGYSQRSHEQEGYFMTSRFKVCGNFFHITADVNEGGYIETQICDDHGHLIEGFDFGDCVPVTETVTEGALRWNNADLSRLSDRLITLCFRLKDATLFAFGGSMEHIKRIQGA